MRYLASAMLVVVGIIHLLPLPGLFGKERLAALYGLAFDEPNLEVLMRHRAALFGLLWLLFLVAAFRPEWQDIAFAGGFASVLSFLYLARSVGGCNPQVRRVVPADVLALACRVVGVAAYFFVPR